MEKLVFATNNAHKLAEIKQILGNKFDVLSLADIRFQQEIEEPFETLKENAFEKARVVHAFCGLNVFADDTGLMVDALNGAPGVYSARFAGEGCSFEDNVNKLLLELNDAENRTAKFQTVIALILNGEEHHFIGEVKGMITKSASGTEGFGYDPIFNPDGFKETFAEMDAKTKNSISHRGRAVQKLVAFLSSKV